MATTIKIKSSSVAAKVPDASSLQPAELAINLKDQKLYSKDTDGNVFQVSGNDEGFVKLDDEGTAQNITGGGGLSVSTGAGSTGTRIGVLEDGSAAVGYFQTVRSVTVSGDVAQFTGQDGSVTFKGDGTGSFEGAVSAAGSVTAGATVGGYFTGSIASPTGNLTVVRRTDGNLIDANYSFNAIDNNFVVDQNANLTTDGAITTVFGTDTAQRGNVAPLNDWSVYPARA